MTIPALALADTRLLLLAQDAGELPLLSALVQDATVRPIDVAWDPRGHRLVLLIGRYRWEQHDQSRIRTALRIDHVLRVERRAWPLPPAAAGAHDATHTVLALLAMTLDGDCLTLDFSGGASLRLTLEVVDVTLEDLSAPWVARSQPSHDAA
ncbi:MAG: DUF2948 family protein [Polymorphobacter sp.]